MHRKSIGFSLNTLQKSVIISLIFSAASSGLNYLFQIVIANMLSVSDFGIYNSINSFAANAVVVFTPLSVIACKFTALSKGQYGKNRRVYGKLIKFSCIIIGGMMIIGGILSAVKNKLRLDSMFTLQIFFLMIGISGLYGIAYSIIQGMKCFVIYGMVGNLLIIFKIVLSVLNLKYGMGIPGIIYAMLLSYTVVLLIQCIFIMKLMNDGETFFEINNKEILSLYGTTFIANAFCSFYMNGGEIIFMTLIYDSEEIALYSSAIMLGKVSLYVVSILSTVLFPTFASQSQQENDGVKLLYKSIIISVSIAGIYILLLGIFGKFIIPFFFGTEYDAAVELIPYIAVFVLPLSVLSIVHYYVLGVGRLKLYTGLMGIITCFVMGILYFYIDNIKYVPVILGIGLSTILVSTVIVTTLKGKKGGIWVEK